MKHLVVLGAAICLAATVSFAQVNAVLGGTIQDPSGAALPGTTVTATNVNTGVVTTREANATGNYQFPSLQPGNYTVSAVIDGFQTRTFTNVQLGQGQEVRQNFTLQIATAAQAIEVVAEADTTLGTTTASVGGVLTDRTVANLPLLNRNVLDLVNTAPGVVTIRTVFGADVPNFSGTQAGQVNTTRDGLITNDGRYNNSNGAYSGVFTSPDMVEEVRISTNTVDPTMGRGTGQVQMRTRAGANDFHGALFYTNNNSALTAMDYFDKLQGAEKSYQNRNQYGGRLGGPIWRNKAFFFVLIDNQKYLEKQLVTSTVLTEPARQGIFRFLTAGAPGGTSRRNGNAFAVTPSVDINGNILTSDAGNPLFVNSFNVFTDVNDPNRTRIDPIWISSQYLPRMPLPNNWTVGDGLNTAGFQWLRRHEGTDGATGQSPNPNRNHLTTRFDYNINDSHKVNFTMSLEKNSGVTGQTGLPAYPDGFFGDVVRQPRFYTAAWTAVLTPTILNEFRFGFKKDTWQGTSSVDRGCCWNGAAESDRDEEAQEAYDSFPKTPDGASLIWINPGLGLGDYAPFNVSSPRLANSPLKQFADTVSINSGAHSFQIGFEANFFASEGFNSGGQQTTRPTLNLGIGNVAVPGVNSTNFPGLNNFDVSTAQNLLANLAGTVDTIAQQRFVNSPDAGDWLDYRDTFLFRRKHHQNDWAAFVKDSWKVTRDLTLNLGLRYDKYGTPYDSLGLGGRFTGGQSGLFGISGTNFANAMWSPGIMNGSLSTTEFVGKHSPQPDKLIFGNDWNNFSPSVGFSWNVPFLARATVVRGGYGINYAGAADFLAYSGAIANLPGFNLNATFDPGGYLDLAGLPSAGALPVPTGGAMPFEAIPVDSPTGRSTNITGFADNRVIPYIQSFNFSVQHEIARNLTFEVSWVGNKASKLYGNTQINETNIFENGILDAFNTTRAGGDAALFNQLLMGVNVPGAGVVNGTTMTGSEAMRRYQSTNQMIANGDVGGIANFFNTSTLGTGARGGLLRRAGLPENFIAVNPQFSSVNLSGNTGNSTYHSAQFTLTQRYARGFSGQFSYVFSKTLGLNGIRNPRDWSISKGLAGNNRTHILKFNGAWDLPFGSQGYIGRNAPGWLNNIIGGWQAAPNIQWASGSPLSFGAANRRTMGFRAATTADLVGDLPQGDVVVGNGFVSYFEGYTVERAPQPNFGGDTRLPGRFTNQVLLDPSGNIVIQNPVPGRPGNLAQNIIEGPGQLGVDLSVSKRINVNESMFFTVRADVIDMLNRPIWGNPNTDINSANFGRITNSAGNRTITLNARFDF